MKSAILPAYVFNASAGTIDLSMIPWFESRKLYAILNNSSSAIIYAVATPGSGFTSDAGGILHLEFDTTAMSDSDDLMILYDDHLQSASFVSANISGASTVTAPSYAVGFILQNLFSSAASLRYIIGGSAANATTGMQLEPGRDTGYIPCGANISICPESSTATYLLQWVINK